MQHRFLRQPLQEPSNVPVRRATIWTQTQPKLLPLPIDSLAGSVGLVLKTSLKPTL